MFRKSRWAVFSAVVQLFTNKQLLLSITLIYTLLLAALYLFLSTREATVGQVGISIALIIALPLLFFFLQAASIKDSRDERNTLPILLWLSNAGKLFVISLPVILFLFLGLYLLNKVQGHFPESVATAGFQDPYLANPANPSPKPPLALTAVVLSSIRYLLFAVLAPLTLMHLWISVSRNGLVQTAKRISTHLSEAVAARSVLIYMAGFVVFALLPYFLLFKTTAVGGAWIQIGLFATRLFAAFCLTLFGWVVTLRALSLAQEASASEGVQTS